MLDLCIMSCAPGEQARIKRNKFAAVPAVIDMYLSALTIFHFVCNFRSLRMDLWFAHIEFQVCRNECDARFFSASVYSVGGVFRIRRFDCLAGMCAAAAEWIYSTNRNSWLNRFRWMCRYSRGINNKSRIFSQVQTRVMVARAGVDWVALIRSISACLSFHSME